MNVYNAIIRTWKFIKFQVLSVQKLGGLVEFTSYTTVKGTAFFKLPSNNDRRSMKIQENPVFYG